MKTVGLPLGPFLSCRLDKVAVVVRLAMLPNDPTSAEISKQKFVKVGVCGVFPDLPFADFLPDSTAGDSIRVVDCSDHTEVQFRVLTDPVNKHPDDVVTGKRGSSSVAHQITDQDSLSLRSLPQTIRETFS